MLLQEYDSHETINVGLGDDLPIRELAETVADVIGFPGAIEWDTTKPDGMPRKRRRRGRRGGRGRNRAAGEGGAEETTEPASDE